MWVFLLAAEWIVASLSQQANEAMQLHRICVRVRTQKYILRNKQFIANSSKLNVILIVYLNHFLHCGSRTFDRRSKHTNIPDTHDDRSFIIRYIFHFREQSIRCSEMWSENCTGDTFWHGHTLKLHSMRTLKRMK